MVLDRSFYYERSEYRLGQLHLYKWILCKNGGIISLYSDNAGLGKVWASKPREKNPGRGPRGPDVSQLVKVSLL